MRILQKTEVRLGYLLGFAVAAFAIWFCIWLFIQVPYRMAESRHRDGYVWIAISLLGSPFLAIILLWIAGDRKP